MHGEVFRERCRIGAPPSPMAAHHETIARLSDSRSRKRSPFMRRCWLKGQTGDAVHAVPCCAVRGRLQPALVAARRCPSGPEGLLCARRFARCRQRPRSITRPSHPLHPMGPALASNPPSLVELNFAGPTTYALFFNHPAETASLRLLCTSLFGPAHSICARTCSSLPLNGSLKSNLAFAMRRSSIGLP